MTGHARRVTSLHIMAADTAFKVASRFLGVDTAPASLTQGRIGMTECASNPGSCEQEPVCPVRINWQRISLAVRGALEKIPLSEMMASPRPPLLRVGPPFPADDASGKGEDVPATAPAGQGRALETP